MLFWAQRLTDRFDWRRYLETGTFVDPQVPEFHRAVHYWHHPDQLRAEREDAGFAVLALYGMDRPAPEAQELLTDAPDAVVEQWVDVAVELSRDERNLAASNHLLTVIRGPA